MFMAFKHTRACAEHRGKYDGATAGLRGARGGDGRRVCVAWFRYAAVGVRVPGVFVGAFGGEEPRWRFDMGAWFGGDAYRLRPRPAVSRCIISRASGYASVIPDWTPAGRFSPVSSLHT